MQYFILISSSAVQAVVPLVLPVAAVLSLFNNNKSSKSGNANAHIYFTYTSNKNAIFSLLQVPLHVHGNCMLEALRRDSSVSLNSVTVRSYDEESCQIRRQSVRS